MQIVRRFQGREISTEIPHTPVVLGRPKTGVSVDIDLSPDQTVSRPHARIGRDGERYWIEDLRSRNGTFVNDERITDRRTLGPDDVVRLGETTLRFASNAPASARLTPARPPQGTVEDALVADSETTLVEIAAARSASAPPSFDATASGQAARRLAVLYALPLQLAAETRLDVLLQSITQRIRDAIPGAARAALLVRDANNRLLLKAHVPAGEPAVSSTLAERAMREGQAFLWRRTDEDLTASQRKYDLRVGMYAPLIWQGQSVGVICVDNGGTESDFDDDALQFLVAVAHHAAMALVQRQLQDELQRQTTLLGRLLTNFSPKIRARLLEQAARQRLRLGGEKSEVTILASDIRGFTRLSARMDPEEVVDMLNDYFAVLVGAIFAHDGTVDKFVGDAILAVFGSPEADPAQHEKAVKAAVMMQQEMRALNDKRRQAGLVTCEIGIGLHCGEVLHGFIGSNERMEFTVIGDAVNFTARYCDGAKPGEVLISPALHERVWQIVDAEPTSLATKHEGDLAAFRAKCLRAVT